MARYPVNGNTISRLRKANNLSQSDFAIALKIDPQRLRKIENSKTTKIGYGQVRLATAILGVNSIDLSSDELPEHLPKLIDFRTSNNLPARITAATLKYVHKAKKFQVALGNLFDDNPELKANRYFDRFSISDAPVDIAKNIRKSLELSWNYQVSYDKTLDLYRFIRAQIELRGISVCEESYPFEDARGFCLSSDGHNVPIVVINRTRSNRAVRSFTLLHELIHVLLRKQGISDFTKINNSVERYCNAVAANILMPQELFAKHAKQYVSDKSISNDDLRILSGEIGASQYSTAIRLSELELVREGFVRRWLESLPKKSQKAISDGVLDPIFSEETTNQIRRGGRGTNKLARIGLLIARCTVAAVRSGTRSELDIFREFGIELEQLEALSRPLNSRLREIEKIVQE